MLTGEHGVHERLRDGVHIALHPPIHSVQHLRRVVVHPEALELCVLLLFLEQSSQQTEKKWKTNKKSCAKNQQTTKKVKKKKRRTDTVTINREKKFKPKKQTKSGVNKL